MAGARLTPPTLPQLVAHTVSKYYTPVLIVLGSLGNLLTLYVLVHSKLRRQSTCQYLSALAVSDTLFLLLLLPPWLSMVGACDVFMRDGFCQVFVYLSYVSCCTSAWLVTGFTVERWVAVRYPLRRPAMCSVQRARAMVAATVLLSLLVNAPTLRFAAVVDGDCNIDKAYIEHAKLFNVSDTLVSFTLPMVIIAVLNWVITRTVGGVARDRPDFLRQQRPGAPPPAHRLLAQAKITRMLVTVSTVFVLLNLPAYLMRLLAYAIDLDMKDKGKGILAALQRVALLFFNTNFGINFLLYCVTGQNFRRALLTSLPGLRGRAAAAAAAADAAHRAASPRTNRNNSISTSLASNYTEVVAAAAATPTGGVVRRWRFDNSRQRQAMEMTRLPVSQHM